MNINTNTNNTNFQAKFLYSDSLRDVANYAVEHKVFDHLNRMQKGIGRNHLKTRLKLDISKTPDGIQQVTFTRFYPKHNTVVPTSFDDYREVKKITYILEKKLNPLRFAMQKIINMGKDAPYNETYREIIIQR